MSDVPRKCTPAEIEEKRRQALEKFKKAQELKKFNQKRNSENRLRLPAAQEDVSQIGKSQLSDTQRAEIEQRRNAAIERAKANKLISSTKAENLKKDSPGKATAPSKVAISQSRVNPYLKPQNKVQSFAVLPKPQEAEKSSAPGKAPPPSKEALTSNRANPYEKPMARIVVPAKPAAPILISLEIVSEDRFVAKTDGYSEAVINEFKKLPTKAYSKFFGFSQLRETTFFYNPIFKRLHKSKKGMGAPLWIW